MKKYTKYRAGVSLFFSVLLVVGVLNVVCPKPTYSEAEHRDLAKMPKFSWATLANGEYISKFQLYFSDTFFGREPLSKIGTWFRSLYSLGSSDEILFRPIRRIRAITGLQATIPAMRRRRG